MSFNDISQGFGVYTSEISKATGSIEAVQNTNGVVTIFSTKGVVNKPTYHTSANTANAIYGSEDVDGNYCLDSALQFLSEGNPCWINRVDLGFAQYNLVDFEAVLSGDDLSFSGDESIFTARSFANSEYVDGVTSDDVDIDTIKTTTPPANFRLYTKFPIPISGYTVSIKEDVDYKVNEVDSTDEYYFVDNQVFVYELLDADGFVVGDESFRFSLVEGTVDIDTNRNIFITEAFKQSSYFGAVYGAFISTTITDAMSGTSTFDTSEELITEDCIASDYDYSDLSSISSLNPVSFFFNDRKTYPAKVMFEGGYNNTIKAQLENNMKDCTKSRADIISFYDTINITNKEYQTIVPTLKNSIDTILATSFSYERDVICMDWGNFSVNGIEQNKPDSWKTASDQLNSYLTYIVEPAFGMKQHLIKDFLSPVLKVKNTQHTTLKKLRLNHSRKQSTGYYPWLGYTAYPKSTPERFLHVQWLKLFMLDRAELVLEPFIGEFNNKATENNIRIGLDEAFQDIKKFLDAPIKYNYTKIDDTSIRVQVGILPTSSLEYIYFQLVTHSDVETLENDFS